MKRMNILLFAALMLGMTFAGHASGETLEEEAIKENPKLKSVTIPASVTSIEDGNFDECPQVVIRTPKNSKAWIWANEHEINVEELN